MIRRWFGKRGGRPEPPATDDGQSALALLKSDWQCACCGEWHYGIMEIGSRAPDPWPHDRDHEPNGALRMGGDFLSDDFCVLDGGDFFIRGVLPIPVHGLDRDWNFGCWTTLSRPNFEAYVAGFDRDDPESEEPWFGWLSNRLLTIHEEDEFLKLNVVPRANRQRPEFFLQDTDHPLGRAQRNGISADDLLAILRAYGHGPTEQ